MKWFRNLKKWQKGALIGCGVGLLFSLLLFTLLLTAIHTFLHWWLLWAYLFHFWPLYAMGCRPLESNIILTALMFFLTLFYAGLGSIWGLILQIKRMKLRLIVIIIFSFVIAIYYLISAVASLGILLD